MTAIETKIKKCIEPIINNLGYNIYDVIYEKEGNLEKALELYEKAENICHNKIYTNNIERCNNLIEERKKEEDKFLEALALFEKENIWVINELKLFYLDSDENNNVICSYKRLPSLLKCSESKSQELLNMCKEKICFSKMTFPHQLIRVFLLEQIFRGFKILNNETYHR